MSAGMQLDSRQEKYWELNHMWPIQQYWNQFLLIIVQVWSEWSSRFFQDYLSINEEGLNMIRTFTMDADAMLHH